MRKEPILLLLVLLLAGCGQVVVIPQPAILPTLTPTPTTIPTSEPIPPTAILIPTVAPTATPVPQGPDVVSFTQLHLPQRVDGFTLKDSLAPLQLFRIGQWEEKSREVKPEWIPGGASACGLAQDDTGNYSYLVGCADSGMSDEAFRVSDVISPIPLPMGTWEQIKPKE